MSNTYFEEQRRFNFGFSGVTYGVQFVILANVLVFCVQLLLDIPFGSFAGGAPGGSLLEWVEFSPSSFVGLQLWGVFTYMFLHSGLMHLFQNMLMLFVFGPEVERTLGTRQFFRFYVLCGVLAALANFVPVLLFGGSAPPVIGASGAALAVLLAFVTIDPDRQFFLIPIPFPITARWIAIIFIGMNIITAIQGGGPVAVTTHFGGMAAGFAYMKLRPRFAYWQLQRRIQRRDDPRPSAVPPEEEEKLAEAINNIFKFQDRDRK